MTISGLIKRAAWNSYLKLLFGLVSMIFYESIRNVYGGISENDWIVKSVMPTVHI